MNKRKGVVTMDNSIRKIICGIIGGGVFLFSLFVIGFNPLLSIIFAAVGYVSGLLMLHKNDEIDVNLSGGVTQKMLDETLAEGYRKLKEMKELRKNIFNETVGKKIDGIADIVSKIFDDFKRDPKDIKAARQFLSYYLDATLNIVNKYIDLSGRGVRSNDLTQSLAKVEELLDTIKHAFEKQLEILLKDDVMDLDTELKLLESTIKMEGLSPDKISEKKTSI